MKEYILALDQGTSAMKLMLAHRDGDRQIILNIPYPTYTPSPSMREQDPDDWWKAVCQGVPALLKKAGITAKSIAAIGVDGISWTPVTLDAAGKVLGRSPIWNDTRSTQECQKICDTVGEERVFAVSGNPVQPYYMTSKLLWLKEHEPGRYRDTAHVLGSNAYLVYRLTGCLTQDLTQAYGWAFHNSSTGEWDWDMAQALGFDPKWFPDLHESMAVAGTITASASEQTGLAMGTPVIAGGLDAACGALGAGVIDVGPAHEQSGSAGGMSLCTDHYMAAKGLILSRHVVPGRFLLQGGTVGGGGAFRWLAENLYPADSDIPMSRRNQELDEAAQRCEPGAGGLLFLPYMAGERSPIWDPKAKGVFYGLDFSKTRGHIARAVMEGTAYALRHNLQCANVRPGELRAVGGASASTVYMQIKADITGSPIRAVVNRDATAAGCAMLAAVGCGILPDFQEACKRFVSLEECYTPRMEYAALYDKGYAQYLALYENLRLMMKGDIQ